MKGGARRTGRAAETISLLGAWIAPIAATVVATPYLLRRIGPAEYGLFSIVLGLVVSMAAVGMSRPLAISTAADGAHAVRRAVVWGVALAVSGSLIVALVAALSPLTWLVGVEVDVGHARLAVLAGAFAVLGTALMSTAAGRVIGVSRFVAVGSITALIGVASSIGYVVIASFGGRAIALVLWNGAVVSAGAVLLLRAGRRRHRDLVEEPPTETALFDAVPALWPFVVVQLAGNLAIVVERVGLAATTGLEAVTVFVVPHTMMLTLHAGLVWLTAPLLTRAVHLVRSGDMAGLVRMYQRASRLALAAAGFGAATLAVVGHGLLDRWLDGTSVLDSGSFLVLTVYAIGLPLTVVPWSIADATGHARENALAGITWLGFVVVGAIASNRFGVEATVAARAAMVLTLPIYLRRVERRALGSARAWSAAWMARLTGAVVIAALAEWVIWTLFGRDLAAAGVAIFGGAIAFFIAMPPDVRALAPDANRNDLT